MNGAVNRAFRALGWSLAIAVLVPVAGLAYYDLTRFQPHADEIAQIIADSHPNERRPPEILRTILLTEHRGDLSLITSRLLIFKLEPDASRRGAVSWHGTNLLWWALVKLHLSKDEQLAIVRHTTLLGRRVHGFEVAARTFHQRSLNQLTNAELATLVVRARNPGRWQQADKQDDLVKIGEALLARVHDTKVE